MSEEDDWEEGEKEWNFDFKHDDESDELDALSLLYFMCEILCSSLDVWCIIATFVDFCSFHEQEPPVRDALINQLRGKENFEIDFILPQLW